MLEDKMLILRFKRGKPDAALRIYQKYKDNLLGLAFAFSHDLSTAEDIVHDVFIALARQKDKLKFSGSLKSYLAVCVANRARNVLKERQRCALGLDETYALAYARPGPAQMAETSDRFFRLMEKLQQLPYDQREVLMLHLKGGMKFAEIAAIQEVSINTVQSRYRYGLEKLRSLLNGEADQ